MVKVARPGVVGRLCQSLAGISRTTPLTVS
jgi:hypothetical protein